MPICYSRLSVILSQVSLPPHLHSGSSVLQPCRTFYHCSAQEFGHCLPPPGFCNVSLSDTFEMSLPSGCFPWSLISAKNQSFPSFVLWRHKRDHIFSLSWQLYICFYLCYTKAGLSYPLSCKLFWLGTVF